jgi:hypothetical protein
MYIYDNGIYMYIYIFFFEPYHENVLIWFCWKHFYLFKYVLLIIFSVILYIIWSYQGEKEEEEVEEEEEEGGGWGMEE